MDDSHVLPTKGDASCVSVADYCALDALHVSDVPALIDADVCSSAGVYNSAVIPVHVLYVSPTKGDALYVSDVPFTKGDALCVSFIGYCMLNRDFAQKSSLLATSS